MLSLRVLFICITASTAQALTLTLDQLPAHVRTSHPQLKAARLSIDEARGRQLGAGRLANPEAGMDFRHDTRFREGNVALSFDQRFPLTSRLKLEKELTGKLVHAAELEVKEMERKLISEAQAAAVRLLAHQQKMELTRQQQQMQAKLAKFISSRVAAGEASALDEAQLKLEGQRLELELRRMETERVRLAGEVRTALGGIDTTLAGSLPAISTALAKQASWEQRADYQLAKLKEQTAQTDLALTQAKKWEDISAGLIAEGESHEDGVNGVEKGPFIGLRISLPLPLWNRNQGPEMEKTAGIARSQLETKALASTIRSEVKAAQDDLKSAAQLEKETREKLLPMIQEQVAKLENAYQSGQIDLITVQRASEQRLQAEAMILEATLDYHLARIRLETATGSY